MPRRGRHAGRRSRDGFRRGRGPAPVRVQRGERAQSRGLGSIQLHIVETRPQLADGAQGPQALGRVRVAEVEVGERKRVARFVGVLAAQIEGRRPEQRVP